MNAILKRVFNSIREDFGYPASLLQMLIQYPNIRVELLAPHSCISAESVPLWHELGSFPVMHWPRRDRGVLMGWRASSGNYYESFQLERSEYAQIGHQEIVKNWTCDITEVHGFSASKSELRNFKSTDAMVEANSSDMIDEISHEKLANNLAHREIRIIHCSGTSDHFTRYLWDDRLFLMNSGGSHHFAAAKYIAARLPETVALHGKLYIYSLNAVAIASLRRDFEMFVISDEGEIFNAFLDAMRAFKASWLWHHMVRPFENTRAILLPKREARSMRVATELRKLGILDFGAYLANLAARQTPL